MGVTVMIERLLTLIAEGKRKYSEAYSGSTKTIVGPRTCAAGVSPTKSSGWPLHDSTDTWIWGHGQWAVGGILSDHVEFASKSLFP